MRRRTRHPQDEAQVRHQPVAGAEHGGAEVPPPRRPRWRRPTSSTAAGMACPGDGCAVDRHAAHFHGRQDQAQPRRPQAAHQSRHQPHARRGGKLRRRRALKPCEPPPPRCPPGLRPRSPIGEQRTSLWRGLRFGHYAIEERGLSFLQPAFARRHRAEEINPSCPSGAGALVRFQEVRESFPRDRIPHLGDSGQSFPYFDRSFTFNPPFTDQRLSSRPTSPDMPTEST